jgi:hypothetical protein
MKFPWKQIGSGLRQAIDLAGLFDPRVKALDTLIDEAEAAHGAAKGKAKLAQVETYSDAVFNSTLAKLSDEDKAAFKAIRRRYIAAGVSMRDAAAELQAATDALQTVIEAL